jgi:uncharacterized protein (TIGR02453 family)
MSYFSIAFNEFFKGLAVHNNRDWFQANKKTYEKEVKEPFQALVLDLLSATNSKAPLKDCVFRINKDTRFSKDKTPYKLHVGAVISDGGRKDMQIPGYYLQLGYDETHVGGGMYMPEKSQLSAIRTAIGKDPKTFETLVSSADFVKLFKEIKGDKNKILPADIKPFADSSPFVFNKQFYFMAEYKDNLVTRPDLLEFIMEHFRAGVPLNNYFKKVMA